MRAVRRTTQQALPPRAFSLVELVIVVVIIGIISSIAAPRLSNASRGAHAAALKASLNSVRTAIDAYYAEHGRYPGYVVANGNPNGNRFVNQLLMYSDRDGNTQTSNGGTFVYGPYLRAPFPSNPTNDLSNVKVKATPGIPDPLAGSVGWVAVLSHGYFGISATNTKLDSLGVKTADRAAMRAN